MDKQEKEQQRHQDAMDHMKKEFAIKASIANVIMDVREYYKNEHDIIMRFRDRESNVVTQKIFNKMKKLGITE